MMTRKQVRKLTDAELVAKVRESGGAGNATDAQMLAQLTEARITGRQAAGTPLAAILTASGRATWLGKPGTWFRLATTKGALNGRKGMRASWVVLDGEDTCTVLVQKDATTLCSMGSTAEGAAVRAESMLLQELRGNE